MILDLVIQTESNHQQLFQSLVWYHLQPNPKSMHQDNITQKQEGNIEYYCNNQTLLEQSMIIKVKHDKMTYLDDMFFCQ